jgi:hypothetical protein
MSESTASTTAATTASPPPQSRRRRRLLSIGYSYFVGMNRRLVHEMAKIGGDEWEVVAAVSTNFHGDLRPIRLEISDSGLAGRRWRPRSLSALEKSSAGPPSPGRTLSSSTRFSSGSDDGRSTARLPGSV